MKRQITNLLTSIIPVKSWRHLARSFVLGGGFSLLRKAKCPRVHLYQHSNFGDLLNHDLLRHLEVPYAVAPYQFADFCAIGSLLECTLNCKRNLYTKRTMHIFGSGFISAPTDPNEQFCRPVCIHALRGDLSRKRCEKMLGTSLADVPLGDPGLLIHRIFPNAVNSEKKYDVGIICHMADDPAALEGHLRLDGLSTVALDITQQPEQFVPLLAECRFILSSAMHGLICADSLGIPNAHIVLGNNIKGGDYKFRDYYSAYENVNHQPIHLLDTVLTAADIERLTAAYSVRTEEVEAICDRLEAAFPRKLFEK